MVLEGAQQPNLEVDVVAMKGAQPNFRSEMVEGVHVVYWWYLDGWEKGQGRSQRTPTPTPIPIPQNPPTPLTKNKGGREKSDGGTL